ncbi:hypothetical protein [Actinoplanes subglobosus]|uniref:NB-ARC domain-containing protein n=1 Tax=Actinoplanes subglobosus TaxID=1547892 RepID=A0ABV8J750_9ACTN
MGGQDAIRGFEYQFLRTLEFAFAAMTDPSSPATGIYVESPPAAEPGEDSEAVDFAVYRDAECLIRAQVKTSSATQLTASTAMSILLRLITGPADSYLLLATRPATGEFGRLRTVMKDEKLAEQQFKEALTDLARRSKPVTDALAGLSDDGWTRLRRCRVVTDDRVVPDIRHQMRERVRSLRRQYSTGPQGWDAAGLLLGHLLWDVLSTAASSDDPLIPLDAIRGGLAMDNAALAAAVAGRPWAVNVGNPPRLTDVARPDLIDQIADVLAIPNATPQVPVCVLHGLSGIGKTSLAMAWAIDRSDDYTVVFWIDASTAESIDASFRGVDRWLTSNVDPAPVEEQLFDRIHAGLTRITTPWLLVFDNVPEARQIKRWLPRTGLGHAVVTTTDPSSWHGAFLSTIAVPAMTESQAVTLLERRLEATVDPATAEPRLRSFADHLLRWPLALELASAYLVDTREGIAGVAGYERLIQRALDDEDSIPPDYPRTLVGAVLLALRRMEQRGHASSAADIARKALRFAAFLQPRQIPFHLLMACVMIEPGEDLREELNPLAAYDGDDPPPGEILREMLRGSLVAVDLPIFGGASPQETVRSLDYSITSNEIVQEVIRRDIAREQLVEPVVTHAGYFAQRWLQQLIDWKRHDLAMAFAGHCVYLARAALRHGISNYATALLWGNTSSILGFTENWQQAEIYLRAELDYLRTTSDRPSSTMVVGTYAQLAVTLIRRADRVADVVDEVCDLLDEVVAWHVREARSDHAGVEGATFNAYQVAYQLGHDLPGHQRVNELATRLLALVKDDDSVDADTSVAMVVHELGERLRTENDYEQLANEIDLRLEDRQYAFHRATMLRFLTEAQLHLKRYDEAVTSVRRLRRYVEADALSYLDVETLLTNVAYLCLSFLARAADGAVEVLTETAALTQEYQARGNQLRPGDQAQLEVVRAYLAMHGADFAAMLDSLNRVDRGALESADVARRRGVPDVYWLLIRWAETLPNNVARMMDRTHE